MLPWYNKLLVILSTVCIHAAHEIKKHTSYTINRKFQGAIQAVQFDNTVIHISSHFSLAQSPCVVIFIPTDKVRASQTYSHAIVQFLENFSIPTLDNHPVAPSQKTFFLMSQLTDSKNSTKKQSGELLAHFIEWLYSYNRNCTIILISDRNGNAIINHASNIGIKRGRPSVHTIIQLYPSIAPNTTTTTEHSLHAPRKQYYGDLFIVYSDHVNTFTNKKGLKFYDSSIAYRSLLPMHDNEQIAPEEFLSSFCAQRLWTSLQKSKQLYPHHKNSIVYWSTHHPTADLASFLKDKELAYSELSLSKMSLVPISQERAASTHTKTFLEKAIASPLKTSLSLSESSKHFYGTMSSKTR